MDLSRYDTRYVQAFDRHLTLTYNCFHLLANRLSHFLSASIATHIPRSWSSLTYILNGVHQLIGSLVQLSFTQPAHHLGSTPERTDRIGNPLTSNIGCRTMNRLEHARILSRWVQIRRR